MVANILHLLKKSWLGFTSWSWLRITYTHDYYHSLLVNTELVDTIDAPVIDEMSWDELSTVTTDEYSRIVIARRIWDLIKVSNATLSYDETWCEIHTETRLVAIPYDSS
jgi:hypothetical protein